jgi:hypothetical protein
LEKDSTILRDLRTFRLAVLCMLAFLFWYAATYILMMDCRFCAFDAASGDFVNESAFRGAPPEYVRPSLELNFYIGGASVCWANRVFWPLDALVRRALRLPGDGTGDLDRRSRSCQ